MALRRKGCGGVAGRCVDNCAQGDALTYKWTREIRQRMRLATAPLRDAPDRSVRFRRNVGNGPMLVLEATNDDIQEPNNDSVHRDTVEL